MFCFLDTLSWDIFESADRSDMHACWWYWDWIISHCFLQFTLPFQVPFLLFHHPKIPSSLCICVYRGLELKTTLFIHVSAALFFLSLIILLFLHNNFLLLLKLDLDWLKSYYISQTYYQWHPNPQVYTHTHTLWVLLTFVCLFYAAVYINKSPRPINLLIFGYFIGTACLINSSCRCYLYMEIAFQWTSAWALLTISNKTT